MRHLLRINRLTEMPRGSGLLVGVGGSGKQSLTRLSAYISRAFMFQITLTKTYGMNALMEEHWTNKKNNPAMVNKGDVTPFCAMLVIESVCWLVSQGGLVDFGKIKMV